MNISQNGIDLIKHYEGCSLTAYRDSDNILTIGYGHTGSDVYEGETISQDKADQLFLNDISSFVKMLNNALTVSLEQNQFDALLSFLYNVGPGEVGVKDGLFHLKSGGPSTLWKMIESENFSGAAGQFTLWCRSGGVVLRGLLARRRSEQILFSNNYLDFE